MDNQLSPEDIATLKKAESTQQQLQRLGVNSDESEDTKKPEEVKTHDTFMEIKGLPSKGHFYKESIHGQPLITGDMLLIQNMDDYNMDERFTEIFKRRIRGIKPIEILYPDELFLAYWLRESSFPGELWPHDGWQCEKCKTKVPMDKADFDYRSIKFISNIDEIKQLYGDKSFVEFTLPNSKKECKIYLKRRGHVDITNETLEENFYKHGNIPDDYVIDSLQILAYVDMGYDNLMETYREFTKLSAIDFNEFLKNVKKYSLNTEAGVKFTCPNPDCKEVTPLMGYPFRKEIYFPGNI